MLRFNFNRDRNYGFVDDVGIDVDCSALPSDTASVKWTGEEGYSRPYNTSLNIPLTDPSPYQPFINGWMTARSAQPVPPTLAEAKTIKIELITSIFDAKRQAPFHYVVAAGDFMWEATDSACAGMSLATLPSLLGALTGTSDGTVVGKINALADQINAKIVAPGNAFENQVNQWIVNVCNANFSSGNSAFSNINGTFGTLNTDMTNLSFFVSHWDTDILGLVGDGKNTMNNKLQSTAGIGSPPNVAAPGFSAQVSPSGITVAGISTNPYNFTYTCTAVYYPTFVSVSHASATPDPSLPPIQWTPIGHAAVNLTATEMAGLSGGISTRRVNLHNTRVSKTNDVNALTTIAAVIAYDATAGWPS
jgi:hypothetical protein